MRRSTGHGWRANGRIPRVSAALGLVGLLGLVSLVSGCRAAPDPEPGAPQPPDSSPEAAATGEAALGATATTAAADPGTDLPLDLLEVALDVDVSTRRATAGLTVAPGGAELEFEVGDLTIDAVRVNGHPAEHRREGSRLRVRRPSPQAQVQVQIDYRYGLQTRPQGAYQTLTLTWPDHCGRIYPCHSEPADGVRFRAELRGVPEGATAFYPRALEREAPAYMFAWTYGDYVVRELGATEAGTRVRIAHPPGKGAATRAEAGTEHLLGAFAFLEETYGPYLYGSEVTSVWVDWGDEAYGGMEHHPHWHVAGGDFDDRIVHVHEAAHGWFGNGVRIACWEDFVLSEGVTSYLAARALEAAGGPEVGAEVWRTYQADLDEVGDGPKAARSWPEGCGEHHVIDDGIFSRAPYMRGAFFLRALERRVGRAAIDRALRRFYAERAGTAAHFDDLLETLRVETGFDPQACAEAWLRAETRPESDRC